MTILNFIVEPLLQLKTVAFYSRLEYNIVAGGIHYGTKGKAHSAAQIQAKRFYF